jgi:hypothetical protein
MSGEDYGGCGGARYRRPVSLVERLAWFADTGALGEMRVEASSEDRAGCETFPGRPTHDEVTAVLDAAGVGWRPYPPLTLPGQTALIVDTTAVTFVFEHEDDGAPPFLNVAGASGDFHECPKAPASPR